MEEAIKDMVLAGIGGNDIRREVISTIDILSRSLFDIISLILKKKKWIGSNRELTYCISSIFFSTSEQAMSQCRR